MAKKYICTNCSSETTKGRKYCDSCYDTLKSTIASQNSSKGIGKRLDSIKSKTKKCIDCEEEYNPTGSCSKRCSTCAPKANKISLLEGQLAYRKRNGLYTGTGKGGSIRPGKEHPSYKNGKGTYIQLAKDNKEPNCERCKCSLDYNSHYLWCVHHRDHNRENNELDNLELLCKRCHQMEHECWKNLPNKLT